MGRAVLQALEASAAFRRTVLALSGVLAYLLIGRALDPGFTHYWWYQLLQTGATLAAVIALNAAFAAEGGLAWQTHLIVVVTTLADTLGTAGHLYDAFDPYDKIVHFWSGAALAAAAAEVLEFLRRRGIVALGPGRQAALAVAAGLLLAGVFWETYEYLSDVVFGSGRVNGRQDTIHDAVADGLGALLAVLVLRRRATGPHAPVRPSPEQELLSGAP